MYKLQRTKIMMLLIFSLMLILAACGAGEQLAEQATERLVEEVADQALGEGAVATSQAFTAAIATETAGLAENETANTTANTNTETSSNPASNAQNDANSGGDAGMADAPTPIVVGTNMTGMLTGVQNGGDMFDVYQIQAGEHEIVRVTVRNETGNTEEILFDMSNSDGYDTAQYVVPGGEAVLVLASTHENLYALNVSYNGEADTANYSFDVSIEGENDANSGADAPDSGEPPLDINAETAYRGISLGDPDGGNNVDCYQITLPADGSLQIRLSAPAEQPFESFVHGELYDSTNDLITSNTAQYGSGATLDFGVEDYETAVAGTYIFCLSSYEFYSYGEYEFTASLTGNSTPSEDTNSGANDACLVGTWRVSNFDEYLVGSVKDAMGDQSMEVASTSSGDLLLSFDATTMTMSDNGFGVTMSLMGVTTPVSIDASGTATYSADGSILTGYVEAVVVQESGGIGISLANLVGNDVTYTCTGNTMTWSDPYATPIQFEKIN